MKVDSGVGGPPGSDRRTPWRHRAVVGAWLGLVLLPDLLLRGAWLTAPPSAKRDVLAFRLRELGYLIAAPASLTLWLTAAAGLASLRRRRPAAAWVATAAFSAAASFLVVGALSYFAVFSDEVEPVVWRYVLANPRHAWSLAWPAIGPPQAAALVGAPLALFLLLRWATRARPSAAGSRLSGRAVAAIALLALALGLAPPTHHTADLVALRAIALGTITHFRPGAHEPRTIPVPARRALPERPPATRPDVVLFIHESLGADHCLPWRSDGKTPELAAFLAARTNRAVWFGRAAAAANWTVVALPSLLTGLAVDAPRGAFARAPLLWHHARAHGYRTALVTSQDFHFEFFQQFFLGGDRPDMALTASELRGSGERRVELGVDDALAADAAIAFLRGTPVERPLLLVVQFEDTHWPCWSPGTTGEDTTLEALAPRCDAAVRYVDHQMGRVLDELALEGRLSGALVIGTSDHGESFAPARPKRLYSFYDDALTVPLFVHLPADLAGRLPALRENRDLRVGNIDIVPTVLDAWGDWPAATTDDTPPCGQSLLRPIDPERVMVALSNTPINYGPRAFALYHGRWKWIVDGKGARLFDLERDPGEAVDRSEEAPAERAVLLREARQRPFLGEALRAAPGAAWAN